MRRHDPAAWHVAVRIFTTDRIVPSINLSVFEDGFSLRRSNRITSPFRPYSRPPSHPRFHPCGVRSPASAFVLSSLCRHAFPVEGTAIVEYMNSGGAGVLAMCWCVAEPLSFRSSSAQRFPQFLGSARPSQSSKVRPLGAPTGRTPDGVSPSRTAKITGGLRFCAPGAR